MAEGKLFAAVLDQVKNFRRAGLVVQVAPVAGNADFQIVGIRPAVQAESVVVGLQRYQVTPDQVILYDRRQIAKVSGKGHHMAVRCADAVTAAGHVMAGGKRCHGKLTNFKRLAVHRNCIHRRRDGSPGLQGIQRIRAAVQRGGIFFQEGVQPGDVVGVLVRDEDASTVADGQS